MSLDQSAVVDPVGIALIGAGRIGASHASVLATRVPGARLITIVDPRPGVAEALGASLGCPGSTGLEAVLQAPEVDAVVIAASSTAHVDLIEAAAAAGKGVFCEKPMGMTLAEVDRGIEAAAAAGVALQVGFNRRFARDFARGHALVVDGAIGTPQLLRSLTRDPGLADPGAVPPHTIFTQTLIHDFDTLLWLNPGAEPVQVYAAADALVAPDYKSRGLLDTAVVVITFDNGALAVAEASFSASYGYDVRGEVFGSGGMVTLGGSPHPSAHLFDERGGHFGTVRSDVELFADAYAGEFTEFTHAVRERRAPTVTGHDARRALTVALASIRSVESRRAVSIEEVSGCG